MNFKLFPIRKPSLSENLPLTLMTLKDWTLVDVTGSDAEKYLQSQVTADVSQITQYQHCLVAHCNPKGKMWSNLLLFRHGEGFYFIHRKSVRDIQLNEMKKYSVFSKVMFTYEDNLILLGIAGYQARYELQNLFSELPDIKKPLIRSNQSFILWFEYPIERFLLIVHEDTIHQLIKVLNKKLQFSDSQQWLTFQIEAGIPVIDPPNAGKFIPQATNLQMLGGISFNKGCYIGQEIVAKTKFLGMNKRVLRYLSGTSNSVPNVGENLELKIDKKWCRSGIILAAVLTDSNKLLVQAVMNNNIELNSEFRVQNDKKSLLKIKPLPYLLE